VHSQDIVIDKSPKTRKSRNNRHINHRKPIGGSLNSVVFMNGKEMCGLKCPEV
jgi:hypothetical protein